MIWTHWIGMELELVMDDKLIWIEKRMPITLTNED